MFSSVAAARSPQAFGEVFLDHPRSGRRAVAGALGAQRIGELCGSLSKSLEVSLDIELPNPIDSIIDYIHAFHQYFDLEEFLITAKELNEDFTLKSLRIAN